MFYRIYDYKIGRYLETEEGFVWKNGTIELLDRQRTYLQSEGFEIERGITDKHKLNLYENDIVKCKKTINAYNKFDGMIGFVTFKNGQFFIEFEDRRILLYNDYRIEYEVIGNKHFNEIQLTNYYNDEDIYRAFANKMLDMPNDEFDVSVVNSVTTWLLEIDDYGKFKILKNNRDQTVTLCFTVDGLPKQKVIKDVFDEWDKKFEQYKQEKKERFEEKAVAKLQEYLNRFE